MTKDMIDLTAPVERAFLVAVDTGDDPGWTAEESIAELASLADTAGAEVVGAEWQNRRHVDPNCYVGKGKVDELVAAKSETGYTSWSPTTSCRPPSSEPSKRRSRPRSSIGRVSSWTSSPSTPRRTRAASRWSWPSSSTSCRA